MNGTIIYAMTPITIDNPNHWEKLAINPRYGLSPLLAYRQLPPALGIEEDKIAYEYAAKIAGIAANKNAGTTYGPIPGTFFWIINGMTFIEAPIIEHIPVAVTSISPICLRSFFWLT